MYIFTWKCVRNIPSSFNRKIACISFCYYCDKCLWTIQWPLLNSIYKMNSMYDLTDSCFESNIHTHCQQFLHQFLLYLAEFWHNDRHKYFVYSVNFSCKHVHVSELQWLLSNHCRWSWAAYQIRGTVWQSPESRAAETWRNTVPDAYIYLFGDYLHSLVCKTLV